jgi:hypothetical protein
MSIIEERQSDEENEQDVLERTLTLQNLCKAFAVTNEASHIF